MIIEKRFQFKCSNFNLIQQNYISFRHQTEWCHYLTKINQSSNYTNIR